MKIAHLLTLLISFTVFFFCEASLKDSLYYRHNYPVKGVIKPDFKPTNKHTCYDECMHYHFAIVARTNRKYACTSTCGDRFEPDLTPRQRFEARFESYPTHQMYHNASNDACIVILVGVGLTMVIIVSSSYYFRKT